MVESIGKIERFTRKVVEHNNLWLGKGKGSIMERVESGGTIHKRYEGSFSKEINFLSKVYSRSLLKGSPLSCALFEEVISSPQYGYRYLSKMKEICIFSTVWIPIFE